MFGVRKISVLVMWALLIAAVIVGFFWIAKRNPQNYDSRFVLTDKTAVIIEFVSFPALISELQTNNKMWKEISSSGLFTESSINLERIDSLFKKETQVRQFFEKRLSISISLKANKSPGILFCLPESVRNQDKLVLKFLEKQIAGLTYTKRRFERNTIFDLNWQDSSGTRNFSFASIKGILVGSFSAELVEESLRQSVSENIFTKSREFGAVSKTLGSKVLVNVFVNYKNAAGIFKSFLDPVYSKQTGNAKSLASWGALDTEIYSDKLILNGFSSLNDSLNEDLRIFSKQEPVEFNCPVFLPDAVSFFKVCGFSDKDQFFRQLSIFLKNDPSSKDLLKRKNDLLQNFGIDLDKGFAEMIGDEFGSAGIQSGRTSTPFFFMELKSQSLAEQQFRDWLINWALKNGRAPSELMLENKIDNNNTITVYKFPVGGIPSMVFGPSFKSPENDYFTFINNYVIFANSYSSLKEFIYQVILGNTLASGTSYSSLGENISTRSNYYYFAKPASLLESSDDLLSGSSKEILHKSKETISKFNAISLQYSSADDLMYSHLFINYSGVFSGSVNTVWESRIDTCTVFKPAIVVNHLTGEKEILIQDQKNQFYLLSNAGIILWKEMLDGQIMSEIFQVDYYKNGKLQYLFNTGKRIYLLDRNGNSVEKFPVELRSPATAGISVFDYDKDGTIRICVPCEDKKIYMYDKDGKIIPGWQAERTDNEVLQPVQLFRAGSKDYIVAIDKYKFYILDRKGKNRVPVKKFFQVSSNNCFYLDVSKGESLARIVTTDTTGSIMRVYFTGKVEKILERNIDADHFFVFADLDGDQKGEYLTASGKSLQVLSPELKESFEIEFNDVISYRPVIYKFSVRDNKIGIVIRNRGNIYLYNNNGALYKGFPLLGSAPFSISSFPELSGRFNMIVGAKNNFLYNYSVQ